MTRNEYVTPAVAPASVQVVVLPTSTRCVKGADEGPYSTKYPAMLDSVLGSQARVIGPALARAAASRTHAIVARNTERVRTI